jgi:predicted RNA-binding Zn ribbon-like protein
VVKSLKPSPPPIEVVPAAREELCLDFVNTLAWRGSERPAESLGSFEDLLEWCAGAGGSFNGGVPAARAMAERRPAAAIGLLRDAIGLREAISRIFYAVAEGLVPDAADMSALNRELRRAPLRTVVDRAGGAFGWRVGLITPGLPTLLAPILWSAGDLLTGRRRARVRQCANADCRWLFIDESKAGTRRWCSMTACGNRAKAHRHYVRHKRI